MAELLLSGRYRLHEVLGRGGMATVWSAQDLQLQHPVAVKMLSPALLAAPGTRERLGREARILARQTHPNIVAVHDFDVESDTAYLVLELVEGSSLATLLSRGALPVVEQAVGIATQVCDALAAAHAAGIQHRDIKPANIIVTPNGVVKVCDFGIAQPYALTLHDLTAISGMSEYVAPERAAGDVGDARADLYALGCVLYAMLSGGPPFTGRTPVAVLQQHMHEVPVPLVELRDDVPAELDRLVLDLLDKDPARRPGSAEAVRHRLTALTPAAVAPPPTAVIETGAPTARVAGHCATASWSGPRWALLALAVLVLVGGILAVLPELGGSPVAPSVQAASDPTVNERAADGLSSSPSTEASGPATSSSPSPAPAPSATPGRPATLVDQYNNLQAVITHQVNAGQLDPDAAADLRDRLAEAARRLSKGQTDAASSRLDRVRQSLSGLVRDGKLTNSGFQAVSAALDRFAGSVARAQTA